MTCALTLVKLLTVFVEPRWKNCDAAGLSERFKCAVRKGIPAVRLRCLNPER
jgi:hypothetical protein